MVADFEERWVDPAAVLETPIGPTPEELARKAEEDAQLLDYAAQIISGEDCEKVRSTSARVFALDESHREMHLALAECALDERDLATAKARFEGMYDDTQDARAARGLGLVAILDGKHANGRRHLTEATRELPEDWRSWNGLGFAEDALENWAAAEEAYRRAASLSGTNAGPLNNLAMSYIRQERFEEAIELLKRGLAVDNRSHILRLNLRLAHALNGQIGTALAGASDAERAIIYNTVGVSALSDGRREYARHMFNRALASHPGFYERAYENLERTQFMSLETEG